MPVPADRFASDQPGILDAIFSDLPEEVRRTYRLSEDGRSTAPAARRRRDQKQREKKIGIGGLGRADWKAILVGTKEEIGEDRILSVAGGVTFFGLLALFPAITALVSIYGLFTSPEGISRHLDRLSELIPPSALDIIRTQVESIANAPSSALSVATVFGILLALYSANGGMKAIIGALNVAWLETEKRSFLGLNLQALAFTLGGIVLIMGLLVLIAVIPAVIGFLHLGAFGNWLVWVGRWPLALVILICVLAALYRWGPSVSADQRRWHRVFPGAILAAIGLVAASMLFSWYAANFADYNKTYGSLGAVVVLMMWMWIASIVVMVGAEFNSEIGERLRRLNGLPDRRPARRAG